MIELIKNLAIILILSVVFTGGLKGQECPGCYFSAATLVVQNDVELQSKIKMLFPKLTHRKKAIEFRVDTRIEYIPLYNAFEGSNEQDIIDSLTLKSSAMSTSRYDEQQRFESYQNPNLERLSPTPDADLTLRFSQCRSNYVVAELLDGRINYGRTRYGKVLHILFVYDGEGFVKKVITSSYTYN
jgi:hypothetical protein